MYQRLKERLVGAAVLVIIAVICIPIILTGPVDSDSITKTNIPKRPDKKISSKSVSFSDTLRGLASESVDIVQIETEEDAPPTTDIPEILNDKVSDKEILDKDMVKQDETFTDKPVGLSAWVVQLGSFSSKANADKLNLKLRKNGFPAFVEEVKQKNEIVYRVRIGPELLRSDADVLLKKIKTKMDLDGVVFQYP